VSGIGGWLPEFDVGERHEATLALPPEQALARFLAVPVAPGTLVALLLRLRGLEPSGSLEDWMTANGFLLLERTPTTFVVGRFVGRGAEAVTDPASWRAAQAAQSLKLAADFRAEPVPGGARLVTETRVAATGRWALAVFRLYWFFVGPFSSLIRRRWLRAAATPGPHD
jgi:hypothetical protein